MSYYHVKRDETTKQPRSMGVFNYYNTENGKWETNTQELKGLTETKSIGKINPDYVGFESVSEVQKNTKGYSAVFKIDSKDEIEQNTTQFNRYWLASLHCYADVNGVSYGIYYAYDSGFIDGYSVYSSYGRVRDPMYGVRPVVSLKPDIQLTASTTNEKTYEIN